MKAVNYIANAALIVLAAMALSACGKKSNGSAAAAAGACNYNGYTYVNAIGQPCSATGQTLCPANGVYVNQMGQQQACTPGQYLLPTNPGYPTQYQYGQVPRTSCQQYAIQYGIPYVPMILQGQYVCVRYDLLQQQQNYSSYNYGDYYDYGYDYYYAYPPYSGSGCGTSIDFGGSWGSIGICF